MTAEQPVGAAPQRAPGTVASRRSIPVTPMRDLPSLMRKLWGDRLSLLSDAAGEYGDAVRFRMGPRACTSSTTQIMPSTCSPTMRPTTTRAWA